MTGGADEDRAWLTEAIAMNGATVHIARVDDSVLALTTASGIELVISNKPQPDTGGEPWHLSGRRDS